MPRLYGFEDMAYRRVREAEAEGIRAAASRRLLTQTWAAIVEWMNDTGYRTTRGGLWKPDVLANVLDHPAIAGCVEGEDGSLVETGGPAIIPKADFLAIRAMRTGGIASGNRRTVQREYLISGQLGICGLSGHPLSSSPSNSGSRGYRCDPSTAQHPGGCGKVRINADLLETYVGEHVVAELAKPQVSALLAQAREEILGEAAVLRKEAAAARRRQKALGQDYAKHGLSRRAFKAADGELARKIHKNEVQARFLEQAKHVPVGAIPDLAKWWTHAPLKAKQGVLVLMLKQIAVYPAASRGSRTVDSDRVALTWRVWGHEAA
ncbi:recombinase family protein [Streptomyces sp. NBC_01187]|uniref:recombinase family protein n=1 Tax=Streptomyces sp. NBC_01187 TaxID=2903766 RepID=UPI00386634AC|nr:recombinase family protein [Streptomyces sp. NBC_01187]